MIRVSVLYPNSEGSTFDMEYYLTKHMPMVRQLLGGALKSMTVEQGLSGPLPGSTPAFTALAHLGFDSIESYEKAFGPNASQIQGDVPNYTNTMPTVQVSEVKI